MIWEWDNHTLDLIFHFPSMRCNAMFLAVQRKWFRDHVLILGLLQQRVPLVQHQLANLKYCGDELRTFKHGWQQEALSLHHFKFIPYFIPSFEKSPPHTNVIALNERGYLPNIYHTKLGSQLHKLNKWPIFPRNKAKVDTQVSVSKGFSILHQEYAIMETIAAATIKCFGRYLKHCIVLKISVSPYLLE